MTTKSLIKKIKPEKVAIIHNCTEKETLNRLSQLLVGNGHPEDGYVYKVIEMGKQVSDINEKLTGISGIVKELHEESTSKRAINKTDKEIKAEKRLVWQKWIQTGMFIIAAFGLIVTAYFSYNSDRKIGKPKDTLTKEIRSQEGISKVTRGGYVKYNDQGISDSVKIHNWGK
jgi:hypothetical protein